MVIAEASPFIVSLEHIIGFVVVLFVLGLLYGLTALIGSYFARRPAAAPARPAAAAAGPATEGDITDEEVVAISACAALLMGRRSRVVSIRSSAAKDWNREGRREHFASHRIR